MSDATILYFGMFCFGLILLAFVMTMREFRRMPRRELPSPQETSRRGRMEVAAIGRVRP